VTAGATPRVVVVGAGLTGLATAWHLRDDAEVTLLEASPHVGGEVRTVDLAGAPMDIGADAFLARQPAAERLARAAGFGDDDLVAPATDQVHLWVRGRLRPLPAGTVLGAPTDLLALARSGVLSPAGLARAAAEPLRPRRRVIGDRSVLDLVGERFGREVVQHLVEPLLGGVYAGDPARLSAEAAAAPVWAATRAHRSALTGLRAHRRRTADDPRPVFLTLRGGLGRLPARLADDLGDRLHLDAEVVAIEPVDGSGPAPRWRVRRADGVTHDADRVVVATPAAVAARLLRGLAAEASRELGLIRTASVGVVALAYPLDAAGRAPAGSGILVPRGEQRLVKAVTFASRKWPHHAERPWFLLRASVGRIDDGRALALDDDDLADRVDREVRRLASLGAPAVHRRVVRWPDALPQYDVGHRARVERVRHDLAARAPGIEVAGAALDGVGLAARATEAAALAERLRRAA
jgi:oxygen-dependent protoporphyrinogen oxidase